MPVVLRLGFFLRLNHLRRRPSPSQRITQFGTQESDGRIPSHPELPTIDNLSHGASPEGFHIAVNREALVVDNSIDAMSQWLADLIEFERKLFDRVMRFFLISGA